MSGRRVWVEPVSGPFRASDIGYSGYAILLADHGDRCDVACLDYPGLILSVPSEGVLESIEMEPS